MLTNVRMDAPFPRSDPDGSKPRGRAPGHVLGERGHADAWRRAVVRSAGVATAGLGGLGLAAWATGDAQLGSLVAGWQPMRASSALLLVAVGLALAASARDRASGASRWTLVLAAFAAVCAAGVLVEHVLRADIGLDGLLPPSSALYPGPLAARMPLARGIAFLCAAAALLALGRSWRSVPVSEWLGLACAAIGGLGILGVLFAEPALGALGSSSSVAFPTSVGLTLVGVGIMAAPGTSHRLPAVLTDSGPAGVVARRTLPAAILLLPLIGAGFHLLERAGLVTGTMADVATVLVYAVALLALGSRAASGAVRLDAARQSAVHALAASEHRFRAVVEQSPDGVLVFDAADLTISDANPAAAAMLGYASLVGVRIADLAPGARRMASVVPAAAATGTSVRGEVRLRRLDGSTFEAETVSKVLPAGQILTTIRDVSERAEAEAERSRLVAAIEQSTDAVVVMAPDATIVYANAAFEAACGFDRAELVGRLPSVFRKSSPGAPADLSADSPPWAAIMAGASWSGDITAPTKDGRSWTAEWSITAVRDASGILAGLVAVARDRSVERALEGQLRQAQKMEAVGQLAGGIAHDFNNLLTAIRGYADLLAEQLPADSAARADADEVIDAADRAAGLTRQLLAFSRRQVLEPRTLDPAVIVAGIAPLLRRLLGEHIDVRVDAVEGGGLVCVDPSQLEQVVVNLGVNARDAMPGGGTLTMRVLDVDVAAADAARQPEMQPGRYVLLEISDTGHGMDEETQARAFEPFFTTKAAGQGTGMGLATVYGIVTQSEGYVDLSSAPGLGTTFRIYLPRIDAGETAPGEDSHAKADPEAGGAGRTILLVEDERAVREFARRVLENCGYRVLAAGDGAAALKRLQDEGDGVDLLVTDLVMPGLGGRELARRVAESWPALPVLFLSGFAPEDPAEVGAREPSRLAKPFTSRGLARAVARELGGRSARRARDRRRTTRQLGPDSAD